MEIAIKEAMKTPHTTIIVSLTPAQIIALRAAKNKGGAWYGRARNLKGGAYRRMCERLSEMKLVSDRAPFEITLRGIRVLEQIDNATA
jgi:hypothetical protein